MGPAVGEIFRTCGRLCYDGGMKSISRVWLAVCLLGLGLAVTPSWAGLMDKDVFTIKEVIDGDTVVVATDAGRQLRVRMIGIDAPELRDTTKARIDAEQGADGLAELLSMGQRARKFLTDELIVTTFPYVYLEYDVHDLDSQGNTLAYVHLCPVSVAHPAEKYMACPQCVMYRDGYYCYMLNALIAYEGYAKPAPVPPNVRFTKLISRLYDDARRKERGLWESHGGDDPRVTKVEFDPAAADQPLISHKQALAIANNYAAGKGHPIPEGWEYIGATHYEESGIWIINVDLAPNGGGTHLAIGIDDRSGDVVRFEAQEHLR